MAVRFGGVLGVKHRSAASRDVALELDQQRVKICNGVRFDLRSRIAPILEVRNGVGHSAVAFARFLGIDAQCRRRAGFAKPLGFRGEKFGAVEMR